MGTEGWESIQGSMRTCTSRELKRGGSERRRDEDLWPAAKWSGEAVFWCF
jgi:hypothetical protein